MGECILPQANRDFRQRHSSTILVAVAAGGLSIGLALSWQAVRHADLVWAGATLVILASLLVQIFGALRRGDVGLDIVAALSMSAAIAFGEPLAGNVVGLMYAGGQLLEAFAEIKRITGFTGGVNHAPEREGDIKHSLADIHQAQQAFGYKVTAGLAYGLEQTIEWARTSMATA